MIRFTRADELTQISLVITAPKVAELILQHVADITRTDLFGNLNYYTSEDGQNSYIKKGGVPVLLSDNPDVATMVDAANLMMYGRKEHVYLP